MKYIKPLQLTNLTLKNNLVQAPLAGYSCAPFRVLTNRYGHPGFCSTEMISAKDLVYRKHKPKRYLWRDPEEEVVCYQLSGNESETLKQATGIVSEAGADIIDLNCGCPVSKIRSKNTGSKLLGFPEKIYDLVTAIKSNTNAVISIKIRVSGDVGDHDDFAVLEAAESAGVDFITVHGRHWSERYDIACRHQDIANIVKKAKVPIIANGDVEDIESFKKLIDDTGCAGVMIARASVGKPWLFQEIKAACSNQVFVKPSFAEIGKIFIEHLGRLVELENEKLAILQSRKLAKYYSKDLPQRAQFVTAMQEAITQQQAQNLIHTFFQN